ncbi:uncharacterized protein LOC119980576 isoform X2 [Tripterygium wilfordii]|uniref:uncharacterized protein LOC119980576 isoform X2 n=1 Tax=Tripterygium wilfordii TaxID=458696 RepID=UPI0018F86303|nr:uncharacterized protein LOC119980576 isoform X2 [Tripterygium wilfordii]
MSSVFTSSRSSPGTGSSRLQLLGGAGGFSRLRSSSLKKPPEPLRRAVADCLSSSAFTTASHQGSPSMVLSDASRTLRDYLAAPTTIDLAYSVIIEHTIAERERSPAVVARCVALLKRYLLRSFNSQLNPANVGESVEKKDATTLSMSNLSNIEEVEGLEDFEYIAPDVLKWRWLRKHHSSPLAMESDRAVNLQEITRNFLEAGAAALLVGDVKAKMRGQPWKCFGTADMPYLVQLLQPSSVATVTNSASARSHLRAITASKHTKAGPRQIWEDSPIGTFRPRARPLFQYRHYSEQQPLRLNPAEVSEVIAAVSSETPSSHANVMTVSSRISNASGKPSMDVAVSVLVKLVIDMYVLDSGIAAPLFLSMLEDMLGSPKVACRVRAFDLILNLGVHAHLLEPMMTDDTSTIEEEYSQESSFDKEVQLTKLGREMNSVEKLGGSSAIDRFEMWILNILHEILLLLVQTEGKEESVWASALSCLLYFVCDRGKIWRSRLEGLDIRVIKELIETSRQNSWAEVVHSKLICMLTNMFYRVSVIPTVAVSSIPMFLVDQIDLVGGIEFILLEYSLAISREERRNLFLVLFDYVLHQINEACLATGVSEYSDDEIQPLAVLLSLADAPEAFDISVKLGMEGIGELLRRSISAALSGPNSERLTMLLESMMEKFDTIISSFTHLDKEFFHQIQLTKSFKYLESIERADLRNGDGMKAKLSWATLHTLLHSERIAYRRNGHIWLGDLLIAEIGDVRNKSKWSNIKDLQRKIAYAGVSDSSVSSDVPMSIWLMCGLLKSKNSRIRWGFLFVLGRLLMQCKFLLDENDMQHLSSGDVSQEDADNNRLEKAKVVIDVMSSALSLVAQMNETDRINILKMCDILFSQLCLKVPPASAMPYADGMVQSGVHNFTDESRKTDAGEHVSQPENCRWDELLEESDSRSGNNKNSSLICETASMAAMLLRGLAIVPMQLVARVPAALFDWPLIQLAVAATDNIALGVAVGSKGRGNVPGATSDIRATLLLLLIGKCTADPAAFEEVGGEDFFRALLDDTDSRVAYYSSAFLLKRMMTETPEKYQHILQKLVFKAQQSNNEKLLENPYLQMRGIIQLSNDLGTGL